PFPTLPPPFARQSFTEKDINPLLTTEQQEGARQRLRDSRNEGLFTPPSLRGTIELPGHNGGANWASSAVDPTKGTMYSVAKDLPTFSKPSGPGARGAGSGAGGGRGAAPAGAPEAGGQRGGQGGRVGRGGQGAVGAAGNGPGGAAGGAAAGARGPTPPRA